jgi:hypothetical protein
MTPKMGPTETGCKSVPPICGLTAMANGKTTTGVYKKCTKCTEVMVEDSNIKEDPTSTTVVGPTKMDNVTPVQVSPTQCTWPFEDTDGRVHVGISCVLPSSVGTSTAHLEAKVNDKGNVLRVHIFHPKLWSTLKFVDQACAAKKIAPGIIQYCLDSQKKSWRN